MQKITNIQDLRTAINQNGEMVITIKNGNIIMIKMEEYRNGLFDDETIDSLISSEYDIENGRTRNGVKVMEEMKAKYGF